jgi:hypothetical protein
MAEFAHLPQDVRPIAALVAEARIALIRAERCVQHAAADHVLGYLPEALEQPPRERMENILLIGESGMGKTMLVRALLSDSQLRSRFTDIELSPWCLGEDLRDFVTRLTWSLPLREPSPVDRRKCAASSRIGRAASRRVSARRSSGRPLRPFKTR